jgi:hypothetical protein
MCTTRCCSLVAMILVLFAAACNGGGPVTPTGTSRPGEMFEVTGVVTDDQGLPVPGASVTMARLEARPVVVTDASGAYKIAFKATPLVNPATGRSFLARAEILADGYDDYWRTIDSGSHLVENFRLHHSRRLTAGDSLVLSVTADNGVCQAELYGPCGRLRVATPATGTLRVEAIATREGAALPQLYVCCVAGNERYGNPITMAVTAGAESRVEVGQMSLGATASDSVIVKTSFEPF